MSFSPLLVQLIDALRCMPGVGKKSAQRIAFHLLERDREGASSLSAALTQAVEGPILLLGLAHRCRNLPMNHLPFRQDSTFLYFMGYRGPDAMALLHDGQTQLFVPIPDEDDVLWHGPSPSATELAGRYGVERVRDLSELDACLQGLRPKTLAVADEERARARVARETFDGEAQRPGVEQRAVAGDLVDAEAEQLLSDEERLRHGVVDQAVRVGGETRDVD